MKKCLLLFFFLVVSIILLKMSETNDAEVHKTAVKELVEDTEQDGIVRS